MPCQLCGNPSHSGRNHDFRAFLNRLPAADREKLLRAGSVTKAAQVAQVATTGRWLASDGDRLIVQDPAQSEYHSEPSETIRQDE